MSIFTGVKSGQHIDKYRFYAATGAVATLERDGPTMVVKHVPARIGENCGERHIEEDIASGLFKTAEEMTKSGAQVDVREDKTA